MLACLVGMSAEVLTATFTVPCVCFVRAGSVNMFDNRIGKYLVRAGYIYNGRPIYGLSLSQWLRCLLPSNVFLGWQSR